MNSVLDSKARSLRADPGLAREVDDWRADVMLPEALELYERLAERVRESCACS